MILNSKGGLAYCSQHGNSLVPFFLFFFTAQSNIANYKILTLVSWNVVLVGM